VFVLHGVLPFELRSCSVSLVSVSFDVKGRTSRGVR